MGVRLEGIFTSEKESVYLIQIHDSQYAGPKISFDADSLKTSYRNDEHEKRFSPIIGSEAKLGIYITNASLEDFVEDLVGAPEGRFQLYFSRVVGLSVNDSWAGYILPDLVTIDDTPLAVGYLFELRATDGIGRLKTIAYNDAGSPYTGKETFIGHLMNCLLKLDFVNDRYSSSATVLRCVATWQSTTWTYNANYNPLSRSRTDHKVFLEIDNYGNYNYMTCYEVIEKICLQWGARFLYSGGVFWFIQVNEYISPSGVTVFDYVKAGTESVSTGVDLTCENNQVNPEAGNLLRFAGGKFRFLPALRQVRVLNAMYDVENLAAGQTWDQDTSDTFTIENIDHNDGNASMSLFFNLRYTTVWDTGAAAFQSHWFVWKATIKLGTYYLKRDVTISGGVPSYGPVSWTTTASFYYIVGNYKITVADAGSNGFYFNHTIQIVTPDLPTSGNLDVQIQYDSAQNDSGFDVDGTAGYLTSKEWSVNESYVELLTEGTFEGQQSFTEYRYTNTAFSGNSQEVIVYTDFSGGRLSTRPGYIETLNDSDEWVGPSTIWDVQNDDANLSMGNLLAREILRTQLTPLWYFSQAKFQNLTPNSNPLQPHKAIYYDKSYWVLMRGDFDYGTEIFSGDWWKVSSGTGFNREATVTRPPGYTGGGGAVGSSAGSVGRGPIVLGRNIGERRSAARGTTPPPGVSSGSGGASPGLSATIKRNKDTVTSDGTATLPAVTGGSLPSSKDFIDIFLVENGLQVGDDNYSVNAATGVITLEWTPPSGTEFRIIWYTTVSGLSQGLQRKAEIVTSTGVAALPAVAEGTLPSDETLIDVFNADNGLQVADSNFTVDAGTGVITLDWAPPAGDRFRIIWYTTG